MEGVFAIAAEQRIIVGRVTDADGYEELWSFETGDVSRFVSVLGDTRGLISQHHRWHVEWSYDPVSLRPVLAAAGESDMIYLFDHQLKAPYRILPGHGHVRRCLFGFIRATSLSSCLSAHPLSQVSPSYAPHTGICLW